MGTKHLTKEQRFLIEKELAEKTSPSKIAKILGVGSKAQWNENVR